MRSHQLRIVKPSKSMTIKQQPLSISSLCIPSSNETAETIALYIIKQQPLGIGKSKERLYIIKQQLSDIQMSREKLHIVKQQPSSISYRALLSAHQLSSISHHVLPFAHYQTTAIGHFPSCIAIHTSSNSSDWAFE